MDLRRTNTHIPACKGYALRKMTEYKPLNGCELRIFAVVSGEVRNGSDGQRIESEGSKEGLAEYKNQNIEGSILITCGNTFVPGGELEWFSQR